jgi:hypothetical protein
MIEVVTTCPLGSTCEEVKDGKVHRCAWFVELEGTDPQSGKPVKESKCAMAWQPILQIEGSRETNRVAASVQSMRNETSKQQSAAIEVIKNVQIPFNK